MDLSKLSNEDLQALKSGDLSKVSNEGLQALKAAQIEQGRAADRELYSPTRGQSFGENMIQGVGRGMASAGRAVSTGIRSLGPQYNASADFIGLPNAEDSAEAKVLDAPLMKTGGGQVGNVIGNAAIAAPTAMIPGANTALGAGAIGTLFGAATTEGGMKDRAIGAAESGLGGAAGVKIGQGLGWLADRVGANRLASQTANAGRDAAAAGAQKAGYVLPPTEVNPNMLNSALEGLSGKIKTSQSASSKNQPVTNSLAKKELGLPADVPITVDALKSIRSTAGQAYDAVASAGTVRLPPAYDAALDSIVAPYLRAAQGFPGAKLNPIVSEIEALRTPIADAGSMVAKIKELRATADAAYAKGDKDMGKALKGGAEALENAIDAHLTASGAPADLLKNFREARTLIAKTYSVEKALNPTTGNVDARVLAAALKKGKPLSGELETIAKAGQAFPKAMQTLEQNYNALSPLDYAVGLMGAGATHGLGAAATLARPAVRGAILSRPIQNLLHAPDYGPSRVMNLLARNPTLPVAGMALPANQ